MCICNIYCNNNNNFINIHFKIMRATPCGKSNPAQIANSWRPVTVYLLDIQVVTIILATS